MKKATSSILAALVLLVALPFSSSAASKTHIFIDGIPISGDAITKSGTIYLPFRALFESMALDVGYDPASRTVTGKGDGVSVALTVGSKTATVNGKSTTLSAAPFAQNGSTYVPLRFVGEATGRLVTWTKEVNLVQVISSDFQGLTYTFAGGAYLTLKPDGTIEASSGFIKEGNVYFRDISDPGKTSDVSSPGSGLPQGGILGPDTEFVEEEVPGYKGYPDSADITYQMAVAEGRDELPPLLSEGWISVSMLSEIEDVYYGGISTIPGKMVFSNENLMNLTIYKEITLPEEFNETRDGDFEIDGIRIKKYYGNVFFNISDLQREGIISK